MIKLSETKKKEYAPTYIYLPVSQIYIPNKRRFITSHIEKEEFYGFDTETYQGAVKLIADSNNRYIHNPTFSECIDFLFYNSPKSVYRSFWNLDFDVNAIIKISGWTEQKIKDFYAGDIINHEDYLLQYYKGKMFRIKKTKNTVYITDLFQIYFQSLENASMEFLGTGKLKDIDGKRLNEDLEYWENNLDKIIEYCKRDCTLVRDLGNSLIEALKRAELERPRYFSSVASITKQNFRHKARIPAIHYIPRNILDISYHCYYGGRFEMLKQGYFDKGYYYDINSAYPSVALELPSLKYGTWQTVDNLNTKECIGFYKCVVDLPEDVYLSPIPFRYPSGLVCFPVGLHAGWFTWYDLDLIRDYIKVFNYGYEYKPGIKEYYPFKNEINRQYRVKQQSKGKDDFVFYITKSDLNAFSGCCIEKHKKADGTIWGGVLFNPIYASIITGKTRWKVLKEIWDNKFTHNAIGTHTDSILSERKIPHLKIGKKIGEWKYETDGELIMVLTGMYQINDIVKKRSFSKKHYVNLNWFNELEKYGDLDHIPIKESHLIKMYEALQRYTDIDKANIIIERLKKVSINADNKRKWEKSFNNCRELLSSHIDSKPKNFNTDVLSKFYKGPAFVDNRNIYY